MDTIEFDKKVECGPEFVALRILDNCDNLVDGGICLPHMTDENGRLARCVIENCGSKAVDEYGIRRGDYVMIDRLATFAHTAPVCVCRYNNVICFTDKDGTDFSPLKDMVFVEEQEHGTDIIDGIYIPRGYDEKLNIGVISKVNITDKDYPFKPGDKVLLTKGADAVTVGNKQLHIYKKDMLVCRIIEG